MTHRLLSRMILGFAVLVQHGVATSRVTQPLPLSAPVRDKDFYLFSVLLSNSAVRSSFAADGQLARIGAERRRFQTTARQTCKGETACLLKPFVWTEEEMQAVALALGESYRSDAAVRTMVDKTLRPAGVYALYEKLDGADLLMDAWRTCAHGLNNIIMVYGLGVPPRYPEIDSMSLDLTAPESREQIVSLVDHVSGDTSSGMVFEPSLEIALRLLALNHRDEAGRLEPMEAGANQAAVKAVAATPWQRFHYTVIVVPGAGGTDRTTALSEAGRRRTALAAKAYHDGAAPFILVSGGYVHPAQTPFAEAVEMKKALLADFNVPESAILIDPHARHTTTNMRNAAREIFRYGLPTNMPALVVSDAAQTGYIAGQPFADRCLKELGYLPYHIVERVSDTSLAFLPLRESLQQDPMEPLDP